MAFQPDKHRAGVDHTGKSKAFAKPGEPPLAVHHDPTIARQGDRHMTDSIPTRGAPNRMHAVSVHNGMTERQREFKGMGHAIGSAPDASSANPLAPPVPGKTFAPAAPVIGQRSRS